MTTKRTATNLTNLAIAIMFVLSLVAGAAGSERRAGQRNPAFASVKRQVSFSDRNSSRVQVAFSSFQDRTLNGYAFGAYDRSGRDFRRSGRANGFYRRIDANRFLTCNFNRGRDKFQAGLKQNGFESRFRPDFEVRFNPSIV